MENRSIVEYFGEQQSNHCGYCKKGGYDKFSHGMWCHMMTVRDYQDLVDRGWRRCDAKCFSPSKSQKRVMKRFLRYLCEGEILKSPDCNPDAGERNTAASYAEAPIDKLLSKEVPVISKTKLSEDGDSVRLNVQYVDTNSINSNHSAASTSNMEPEKETEVIGKAKQARSPKAKDLRRQRKLEKLAARGLDIESLPAKKASVVKSLEDFLKFDSGLKPLAHKLTLKLMAVGSEGFLATQGESYSVFRRYQMSVHKDSPEDCDRDQYKGFLVDTPLIYEESEIPGHPGYGSFHQQYLLDGKIIAVGVIDILPECVSSKYFYYDPEFMFLTMGTYSALREIAFVRELSFLDPGLRYYYMGFYVHSCPKMRYKGQYSGSFLLCPEAYVWEPFQVSVKKLDESKYSRLSDSTYQDEDGKDVDLDRVLILYDRTAMPFAIYNRISRKSRRRQEDDRKDVLGIILKLRSQKKGRAAREQHARARWPVVI